MHIQPYLFFDGRCEEAVDFYRSALGAEVMMLLRFKESPDPAMVQPGTENKVMHMAFRVGETTVLASDGRCLGRPSFEGFALSLAVADDAQAERMFSALADGGQVQMPLNKTFFASSFGMVADRFGVSWMIYVTSKTEALARRFEAKAEDGLATLERLSDSDWSKRTAAEQWPVGVTAHHLGGALQPVATMVKAMAAGQSLERFRLDTLDDRNARHAKEHADCTKAETVELYRKGAAAAAATIRALRDEDLAKTGALVPGAPPITVEELIARGLLGHIDDHLGSIRKTVGH
jgi:PhnB protein